MRTPIRLAAYALLVLSGVTCTDSPTAPNHAGGMAVLSVVPAFSLVAQQTMKDLGNFGLTVNNIHIHIDHPPAAPFDTVVSIPAGADSITLNLPVILNAPTEVLNVQIELRDGTTVLYSGTQTVNAAVGATGTSTPATVPIKYVGPGASLTNFAIAPRDTAILVTGTVPFRVTATDATGAAVVGVSVHWAVSTAALGTVDATTGIFTPAGTAGTTKVIATTPNGLGDSTTVVISAPPTKLVLVSGGLQTGAAGAALAQPVVVQPQSATGAAVPGVIVSFAGTSGGATVAPAQATTGANGNAQTTVTLGHVVGTQSITASVAGVPNLVISETATAAAAANIAKVSGDAQIDTLGAPLAKPFVVTVTDAFGNVAGGAPVTWTRVSGAGALGAATTTTDATGQASDSYTLGRAVGTDTIAASLAGVSGALVKFTAFGHPVASKIQIAGGNQQTAAPGSALPQALTVLVTDTAGLPVRGATVQWGLTGTGTVVPTSSTTDSAGHAATTLTLGTVAGTYVVMASLANNASATFIEHAAAPYGPASQLLFASSFDTSYASGAHLPVVVQVADANGNPVPQAGVAVEVFVGEGCETECNLLPPGSPSRGLGTAPGRPVAARVRGRPIDSPASARAPMPLPAVSAHGVTAFNYGTAPVLAPMAARARSNAAHTGVAAYNAVPFGSGVFPWLPCPPFPTVVGTTVVLTDATGKAVFTGLNVAGKAYETVYLVAYDTSYSSNLYDAYGPNFHLTPGAPYTVTAAYDSVHQAVGNPVIDDPEVAVLDSVGNAVPGVTVNFAVTGGGGSLDSMHVVTDYLGGAAVPGWTLGPASGVNTVHASAAVSGTPSSADLTAIGHQAGGLRMITDLGSSIVDSTIISPELQVQVTDTTGTWDLNAPGVVITPSAILWPSGQDAYYPSLIGNTSAVSTSPDGSAGFAGLGLKGYVGSTAAIVFSAPGLVIVQSATTLIILP